MSSVADCSAFPFVLLKSVLLSFYEPFKQVWLHYQAFSADMCSQPGCQQVCLFHHTM